MIVLSSTPHWRTRIHNHATSAWMSMHLKIWSYTYHANTYFTENASNLGSSRMIIVLYVVLSYNDFNYINRILIL